MTQKEYKERVSELENKIKKLLQELDRERSKTYNYERVLEDYYITNEELRNEKEINKMNERTIFSLKETIKQYEKIIDRCTINC